MLCGYKLDEKARVCFKIGKNKHFSFEDTQCQLKRGLYVKSFKALEVVCANRVSKALGILKISCVPWAVE